MKPFNNFKIKTHLPLFLWFVLLTILYAAPYRVLSVPDITLLFCLTFIALMSTHLLESLRLNLEDTLHVIGLVTLTGWPAIMVFLEVRTIESVSFLSFLFSPFSGGFIYILGLFFSVFLIIQRKQ